MDDPDYGTQISSIKLKKRECSTLRKHLTIFGKKRRFKCLIELRESCCKLYYWSYIPQLSNLMQMLSNIFMYESKLEVLLFNSWIYKFDVPSYHFVALISS